MGLQRPALGTKIWSTQHGSPGQHLNWTWPFNLKYSILSGLLFLPVPQTVRLPEWGQQLLMGSVQHLHRGGSPTHLSVTKPGRPAFRLVFLLTQSSCVDDKAGRGRVETSCWGICDISQPGLSGKQPLEQPGSLLVPHAPPPQPRPRAHIHSKTSPPISSLFRPHSDLNNEPQETSGH